MTDISEQLKTQLSEVIMRCNHMAYALGLVYGSLSELVNNELMPEGIKTLIMKLLSLITEQIDNMFYDLKDENE